MPLHFIGLMSHRPIVSVAQLWRATSAVVCHGRLHPFFLSSPPLSSSVFPFSFLIRFCHPQSLQLGMTLQLSPAISPAIHSAAITRALTTVRMLVWRSSCIVSTALRVSIARLVTSSSNALHDATSSGVARYFRQGVRCSMAFLPIPIIFCWFTIIHNVTKYFSEK